jgi:hypothetical protein
MQVIKEWEPDKNAATTLQRLCDNYVLERDGLNYHVAYPSALMNYVLPSDRTLSIVERATAFAKCLEQDDIFGVLRLTLQAMHNVPYLTNCHGSKNNTMRQLEGYPHSCLHILLWMCNPRGVRFDSETLSQTSRPDVGIVTTCYRHYLELKREGHGSASKALQQIKTNGYDKTYPRDVADQQKPAFYYGIQWTNSSTHATICVSADNQAEKTTLWTAQLRPKLDDFCKAIIYAHDEVCLFPSSY